MFECMDVTFSNFSVDFKVIWGEDIVDPPRESPLLLLNPPLVIEHVLGSKWHRVPGYGWKKRVDTTRKQNYILKDKQKLDTSSHVTKANFTISCCKIPVCTGLIKVSFDCATATTFVILTDEAPDDFTDGAAVKNRKKFHHNFRWKICL